MSDRVMPERITEGSPRTRARVAGLFYLLTTLTGLSGLFLTARIIVSGDPAATGSNIVANESLYRLAFVADLVAGVCYVVVAILFYGLFRPVNRSASLLATFFGVMGCTLAAIGGVFHLAPLSVLGGPKSPSAFDGAELQALAHTFLRVRDQASGIAFVFFGLYCVLIGYLTRTMPGSQGSRPASGSVSLRVTSRKTAGSMKGERRCESPSTSSARF